MAAGGPSTDALVQRMRHLHQQKERHDAAMDAWNHLYKAMETWDPSSVRQSHFDMMKEHFYYCVPSEFPFEAELETLENTVCDMEGHAVKVFHGPSTDLPEWQNVCKVPFTLTALVCVASEEPSNPDKRQRRAYDVFEAEFADFEPQGTLTTRALMRAFCVSDVLGALPLEVDDKVDNLYCLSLPTEPIAMTAVVAKPGTSGV
jgi:hypothetical protein